MNGVELCGGDGDAGWVVLGLQGGCEDGSDQAGVQAPPREPPASA